MKAFNPEKELNKIQRGNKNKIIIVVVLLLIVSIISYSFALYQVRYSKRIIYTKVAPFSNKDIILTVLVDGKSQNDFPNKDDGYYFNGLDCETKGVTTATWNYNLWTLNLSSSKPNKCNVLFNKEPSLLTEKLKYIKDTTESIVVDDETSDHNLRYIGANPDNYIWFNCDNYDNLTQETVEIQHCEKWRIIGLMNNITVFDDDINTEQTIKSLIKITTAQSIGDMVWNSSSNNNWTTATLNVNFLNKKDTGGYLNPSYIGQNDTKGITEKTYNYIETVNWNLGGTNSPGTTTTLSSYQVERGTTGAYNASSVTIWNGKIGLIYPSDYGYATSGDTSLNANYNREKCLNSSLYTEWHTGEYSTKCGGNSWLGELGTSRWTITSRSNNGNAVWVENTGRADGVAVKTSAQIFPTIYIKDNFKITNGDGSENKPYILVSY